MSAFRAFSRTSLTELLFFGTARAVILLLPAGFLLVAALRSWDQTPWVLLGGMGVQLFICGLSFLSHRSWSQPIGPSIVTLYLTAVAWLWFGDMANDWFTHLSKGILIGFPIIVFGYRALIESGAPVMRRAYTLAQRLANQQDLPTDLTKCRTLPEVKAFRAALAGLEFRKHRQPGQAEHVLQTAQRSEEPAMRAATVLALGKLDERMMIETLAQFLNDPKRAVRRAAVEALLWDSEHRWNWIRRKRGSGNDVACPQRGASARERETRSIRSHS